MLTSSKGITSYGYDPKTGRISPRSHLSTPTAVSVPDPERASRQYAQARRIFLSNMQPLAEGLVLRSQNTRDPRGITPRTYGEQLMAQLRHLGLTALSAGAGGLRRVTEADIQRLDAELDKQRDYMFRWMGQLERADPKTWPSAAALLNRAGMYADSLGALVNLMQVRVAAPRMPELPFMPKDRTLCKYNCKCGWDTPEVLDAAKGDYNIRWRIKVGVEHCATCLVRAEVCNPLQIRGGKIITDLSNPRLYAN